MFDHFFDTGVITNEHKVGNVASSLIFKKGDLFQLNNYLVNYRATAPKSSSN